MADSRQLTVELKGNTRSLNTTLQNAQGRLETFARSIAQTNAQMGQSATAAQQAAVATTGVGRASKGAAQNAAVLGGTLRTAGKQVQLSGQNASVAGGYVRRMGTDMTGAARVSSMLGGSLKDAGQRVRGMGSQFKGASSSIVGSLDQVKGASGSLMRDGLNPITEFIGFNMLGQQARMMGVTVAAALGATVAAFASFEDSFALVEKTVTGTEDQFAALSAEMRELARTTPIAVTELNQVASVAGQLGVETENIAEFTENMAKMGVATNVTAEQAALYQARIGAVMQLDYGEDMERLSSTVVDLGNNFAAREDEIFRFTERISAGGQVVGMATDEILAFSTAFTAVGVRAERGGTAFQRVIFEMLEQVNSMGSGLELLGETAGMTAQEFAEQFRSDPTEAVLRFVEGLAEAGNDANSIMTELFGKNVRTTQSFLALAGAGDLARNAVERGNTAWDQNIALTEEAETRFDTFQNQMKMLQNRVVDVAIEIGGRLAPVLYTVADFATRAVELFGSLPKPIQNFAGALGAAASAILLVGGAAAMMVFPMNVLKTTILPSMQAGFYRLTSTTAAYSAASTAAASGTTTLSAAMQMQARQAFANASATQRVVAHTLAMSASADKAAASHMRLAGIRQSVSGTLKSVAGRASGAALAFGKFALAIGAIWAAWQGVKWVYDEMQTDFVSASDAAENLAASMDMSLDAMPTSSDAPDFSSEFAAQNEELIEQFRELDSEMANISARNIAVEMILRGADPEEVKESLAGIEEFTGHSFDIEVDLFADDPSAAIDQMTSDLMYLKDNFSTWDGFEWLDRGNLSAITETADRLGVVMMQTGEGAEDLQSAFSEMGAGNDLDALAASAEGIGLAFGLTEDQAGSLGRELQTLTMTYDIDNANLFAVTLKVVRDEMEALGRDTSDLDALLKNLGWEVSGPENLAGVVNDLREGTWNLTNDLGVAGDEVDDFGDDSDEAADKAERLADALDRMGETLGANIEAEFDNLTAGIEGFSSALSGIDDDENTLQSVLSTTRSDIESFISFTEDAQSAGVDDWIIGLIQGAGPDAISQARSMGLDKLNETFGGMLDDFELQEELTIDPELAIAEDGLDTSQIVDALNNTMADLDREIEEVQLAEAMGLTREEFSKVKEIFDELPGGFRAAAETILEDPEGLASLQEKLPALIAASKIKADQRLDEWPGNFAGKGAEAMASLMGSLGEDSGMEPGEIEMQVNANTSPAETNLKTLDELIEMIDKDRRPKFEAAVEAGDLEGMLEVVEEVAQEHDVTLYTKTEQEALDKARRDLMNLTEEDREAIIDTYGDTETAAAALAGLISEERVAEILANANDDQAESDLTDLQRQRTAEILARARTGEAVAALNRAAQRRTVYLDLKTIGSSNVLGNEDGGFVSFANGSEDHRAQIAKPGDMRLWAEPETGGEAYIPLAQSKRKRSLSIWEQTGRMLGVDNFASGGLKDDSPSSMYTGDPKKRHRPFWTNPYRDAGSLEEMTRILDQQERTLTLMEREEERRRLESDIREARSEHGSGSSEAKDAVKALNDYEEQVRREDVRAHIDLVMEEQKAIEDYNQMIADNRQQFHDERRPAELQIGVLNRRIEAEEKYTDRWMELVSERDSLMEDMRSNLESMLREEKRIKGELTDLEEQYTKDVKALQSQRQDDIESALEQRRDSLGQFFDPMTRRENEWGNTIGAVTDNIMSQIDEFRNWTENLQMLRDRGLSEEAIDELGFNDPASAASVATFVNATDSELDELNKVVQKQMGYVRDQTSTEQEGMYGDLGDSLRDIEEQFREEMNELQQGFVQDQKDLRSELAEIGKAQSMSYTEAIAKGLRSSIPAIREAAQEVKAAQTGAAESGVSPAPVDDASAEEAPDGYLMEHREGRDNVDRYFVRIGGEWYRAAGPGQQREALRLWGPPSSTWSGVKPESERLVDHFGPGVMDNMVPADTYDTGGILPPGLTFAYNGTRRAEYVAKPMSRADAASGNGSSPTTVVVENYVDGKMIERTVTKQQMKKDKSIRVRAGV